MNLSDDLNLELAWKRHKNDLKDMSFSDHPYETKIIDDNFAASSPSRVWNSTLYGTTPVVCPLPHLSAIKVAE